MRYTEKELRDFITQQAQVWADEEIDAIDTSPLEVAYARGAREAYQFVLTFMDEYRLEEVPEQYFENLLVKMYGEDEPQFVTVSIGGDLTNTEDFEYDGMVFFYFADKVELEASFNPEWDGGDGAFYTLEVVQ
jgi:hypothetical protein